uniref:Uncharacterized protein n=1 Tax=Anguilla anguilla TaxID=7936 RepID=A0A0E9T1B8_ANGAN
MWLSHFMYVPVYCEARTSPTIFLMV